MATLKHTVQDCYVGPHRLESLLETGCQPKGRPTSKRLLLSGGLCAPIPTGVTKENT
jgi:hypothetical protein